MILLRWHFCYYQVFWYGPPFPFQCTHSSWLIYVIPMSSTSSSSVYGPISILNFRSTYLTGPWMAPVNVSLIVLKVNISIIEFINFYSKTGHPSCGLLNVKLLELYMIHNKHSINLNYSFNYFLLLIPIGIFLDKTCIISQVLYCNGLLTGL